MCPMLALQPLLLGDHGGGVEQGAARWGARTERGRGSKKSMLANNNVSFASKRGREGHAEIMHFLRLRGHFLLMVPQSGGQGRQASHRIVVNWAGSHGATATEATLNAAATVIYFYKGEEHAKSGKGEEKISSILCAREG